MKLRGGGSSDNRRRKRVVTAGIEVPFVSFASNIKGVCFFFYVSEIQIKMRKPFTFLNVLLNFILFVSLFFTSSE